jgi:hypothetical protein
VTLIYNTKTWTLTKTGKIQAADMNLSRVTEGKVGSVGSINEILKQEVAIQNLVTARREMTTTA